MLSTELVNEKLASIKSLKVEVLSVTPSSQRLGGIVGECGLSVGLHAKNGATLLVGIW